MNLLTKKGYLILFLLFFFPSINIANAQEKEGLGTEKNSPEEFNLLINNLKKSLTSDNPTRISKKNSSSDIRIPRLNYSQMQILNSDFELGHRYWTELVKSGDNWYSGDYIIKSDVDFGSDHGDWHSLIDSDFWLISDPFRIPINTQNIYQENAAQFLHWDDCSYGINGVQVAIFDETANEVVGQLRFHDPETDAYDYKWHTYYNTLYDVQSRVGHLLSLHYINYHDDRTCSSLLYLDNIYMEAERIDQCADGKCRNHRLYSPSRKSNHYTASMGEAEKLISAGWVYEGLAYQVYESASGNTPVYRLYSPGRRANHFTTSTSEKDKLENAGWTYEGIAYYVSNTPTDHIPVYRLYSSSQRRNHFTTSTSERDKLQNAGWILEGVAYYVPQ